MADVVQYRLERMVDELDDLERKGLFTRREIAEIVKKRRNFEYRLKRPSPLKQDFLAYIDYEKQLDSLRRLRKKSVSRDLKEKGEKKKRMKKSSSDVAGVLRILGIYRLATMRFKGDIDLWFRYLEFCRESGHGRMKTVLPQVLRFHPKVPGLWIYAAAWEFDSNLNVAAARALMQNGLRACPNSEDLWVEYLRMELTYLNKLKARKAALGEDSGTLVRDQGDADEKQWRDENKDLFTPLGEEKENADGSDVQEGDSEKKVDAFREQGSIILRTIYDGAVEALPTSISLRKRFLEVLDETDLAHSEKLRKEILDSMKRDFAKEAQYWDWLARLQLFDLKKTKKMGKEDILCQLNKAVEIYEEALESVPSAKMFSFYTKFWVDVIAPESEDSQVSGLTNTSDDVVKFTSRLFMVFEKAESMGCITEDLALQYISFYLQLGRLKEARKLAEKLSNGKLSCAVNIWVLRVSIEMKWVARKSASLSKDDLRSVYELLQTVLSKVAISEAESLWHMAIKFFSSQKKYFEKLVETFLVFLARDTEGGLSLSTAIVNCILQKDGIQRAREVYKRFIASPHPSLAIYRNCIELESNLAFVGDKDGLANARKLYESALMTYSQDVGLWRDYYSMEIKVGTSETANSVYWRARKTLKDTTGLIAMQDL
ncbi:RNA-processing protein [Macleaya cordata]|uniref:RNA-processing protein n=1 Tax=Macleaya cordata TaxID=56857 RepID=A0A200QIY7_MACCD|nr:RNA-processing protein [Macleaya cordata]